MPAREVAEIVAELVTKVTGSAVPRPVEMAALYRALQRLPIEDTAAIIKEMSQGRFAMVPVDPPEEWNAKMKLGYRKLIQKVLEKLAESSNT